MESEALQIHLFKIIKNRLPAHVAIADTIAEQLGVSADSAYRRIRGEKQLSLDEVVKLCKHFQISLDSILNLDSGAFIFNGAFVQPHTFKFDDYLHNIIKQVQYMSSFKDRTMYQICKDIPIFHHFHFKPIAAFKHYFWMKTILQHPDFSSKKFRLTDYNDELFQLGEKALNYYNDIDSVEIWSIETLNSTIRQIEFYRDSGIFLEENDIYEIYQALETLLLHLEEQAVVGYKFKYNDKKKKQLGSFQMYYNEVIVGDNSILSILDGNKSVFLIHSVINFMITRDVMFCENTYESIQNLIKKSTLISEVSERERSRFFKYLRNRIVGRK
jgi:hypothetical protein